MKRTIAIVMLVVLLVSLFAACGSKGGSGSGGSKDNGESKYIGVYRFSKMTSPDLSMTVQEYAELFEIEVEEAEKFMILELKAGGTGTVTSEDETSDLTWKVDGEKISLTAKDEDGVEDTLEGTIKDGVITLVLGDEEDGAIELTKAK